MMILLIVIDDVRKQLRLGLAPLKSLCVVKQVEQVANAVMFAHIVSP